MVVCCGGGKISNWGSLRIGPVTLAQGAFIHLATKISSGSEQIWALQEIRWVLSQIASLLDGLLLSNFIHVFLITFHHIYGYCGSWCISSCRDKRWFSRYTVGPWYNSPIGTWKNISSCYWDWIWVTFISVAVTGSHCIWNSQELSLWACSHWEENRISSGENPDFSPNADTLVHEKSQLALHCRDYPQLGWIQ